MHTSNDSFSHCFTRDCSAITERKLLTQAIPKKHNYFPMLSMDHRHLPLYVLWYSNEEILPETYDMITHGFNDLKCGFLLFTKFLMNNISLVFIPFNYHRHLRKITATVMFDCYQTDIGKGFLIRSLFCEILDDHIESSHETRRN